MYAFKRDRLTEIESKLSTETEIIKNFVVSYSNLHEQVTALTKQCQQLEKRVLEISSSEERIKKLEDTLFPSSVVENYVDTSLTSERAEDL